ncbi:MAG: hypothetical protein DRI69_03200 [Bacteroidetes bacterium]|nr:MAG: hypothetical protein DRI69_03200 [Bacteroidota bacterium]
MQDINQFPETARVWIYQGNKVLNASEVPGLDAHIGHFTDKWTSHNVALRATGALVHHRFVVLVVNDMHTGVGGCSIDSSVQFVRNLGEEYGMDFMDRMNFAYLASDEVRTVHKDELPALYAAGKVDDNTLFFDNLVNTKKDFVESWLKPLGESWMKRFV